METSHERRPILSKNSRHVLIITFALFFVGVSMFLFTDESSGRNEHEHDRMIQNSNGIHNRVSKLFLKDDRSNLAKKTLDDILNSTSIVNSNVSEPVQFAPPCGVAQNVLESTTSLLVAAAILKADNTTREEFDIWPFFNALFSVPSASGFIPRYSYPVQTTPGGQEFPLYVDNTRIPNFPFFAPSTHTKSLPCRNNETFCWAGSGRVSATPFHGTFLLELIIEMGKRDFIGDKDMARLQDYFERIFDNHLFLHETVMRGCDHTNQTGAPCYNIVHPWESMLDQSSPSLIEALSPTMDRIDAMNWTLPFDVPDQIKESYDYNETLYAASVFITECISNQTKNGTTTPATDGYPYEFGTDASFYEDRIVSNCPFTMLDVGYASALAQADEDLHEVALWLVAQGSKPKSDSRINTWKAKLDKFKIWRKQNQHVLRLSFHEEKNTYLSHFAKTLTSTSGEYPKLKYLNSPASNNLMIFWHQPPTDQSHSLFENRVQDMALQMLHHDGKYSFGCDYFPLWSAGCSYRRESIIDPRMNYFVGVGMERNRKTIPAFGDYLTNMTIDLMCNSDETDASQSCSYDQTHFHEAFPTVPGRNFQLDQCGETSTSSAAIFYHLLRQDFDFSFDTPIPPIRNEWVITLITIELMIAFVVGVSCVGLSLTLVKQENSRASRSDESLDFDGSYVAVETIEQEDDTDSVPDEMFQTPSSF